MITNHDSDAIERAAIAICAAEWADDDEDWTVAGDEQKVVFRRMAKAAAETLATPVMGADAFVGHLRSRARCTTDPSDAEDFAEAANRLERRSAEVSDWAEECGRIADHRNELTAEVSDLTDKVGILVDQIEIRDADVARLREALEFYASGIGFSEQEDNGKVASAALSQPNEGTE